MTERKFKVLMAKPGLEGHWRGMAVVSNALREAGFEVVFGGNMLPPEIGEVAVQEDVDIVGLSIHSSNYMRLVAETMEELKKRQKGDVIVLLGGIIWEEDFPALRQMGVDGLYPPGTPVAEIASSVRDILSKSAKAK